MPGFIRMMNQRGMFLIEWKKLDVEDFAPARFFSKP